MVEYRIFFLQRFKKMLDDGRYGQAVQGTPVEQMHITFNLEFLGSRRLGYNSAYVSTFTALSKKTRPSQCLR